MDVYGATDLREPHPRTHGEQPPAGWDYALVFPSKAERNATPTAADIHRSRILARLIAAGFHYHQRWVPAQHAVLVRLALPEPAMMHLAEREHLPLRTKPTFGATYLPFAQSRAHVFTNADNPPHPYFPPAHRAALTRIALSARAPTGAALDLPALQRTGRLRAFFAPHAEPDRTALLRSAVYDRWWNPLRRPPLLKLRAYLGSRIAIYLAWLTFYARMLTGLAALSVPVQAVLAVQRAGPVAAWTRLGFALALAFWSTYGLEYWKRRNAVLKVQWGLTRFYERSENELRPDFTGVPTPGFYSRGGFVNLQDLAPDSQYPARETSSDSSDDVIVIGGGDDEDFTLQTAVTGLTFDDLPTFPYFDKHIRKHRMNVTAALTVFFSLCVGATSFSILFFKTQIIDMFGAYSFGRIVPGIATGILISIADPLWKTFSRHLVNWENHRTNQSFENSLIQKRFAFQFVSNYISLFYVAFVKPFTPADPCIVNRITGSPDCMAELESLLISLVITKSTVQQAIELGVPFITSRVKRWLLQRRGSHIRAEVGTTEQLRLLSAGAVLGDEANDPVLAELKLNRYKSTLEDYGEVVIQHGTLVLFGLAFPLAALINLINNVIESRTDTYKMLAVFQRPDSDEAADIGGWLDVIKFLTTLSIITNAALVTVTSVSLQQVLPNSIGDRAENYRAVSFLVFEHILLVIRWGVGILVSDTPASTYRMVARQDFLNAKCFDVGWQPYFRGNAVGSEGDDENHIA